MAKKIIQDILKNKKKDKLLAPVQSKPNQQKYKKLIFPLLIAALVFVFGIVILINFSSATVRISPYQEFINIDSQFMAVRGGSGLGFEIIQFEHEESQSASATGISNEGQKARGEIIIYNTSSVSQKLINQTRFQTPDAKIYKTQESIIVPANGSIETTIYADEPGPEYNIGLTDFTLPGLKNTSRYEKIYARSKTEIKEGSMGTVFFVSEEDIKNTRNNLRQKIENYLRETASKQKPADYLLYQEALKIDFYDDPANPVPRTVLGEQDKTFVFKEKGRATGFLIKKDALSKFLVEKYIQENDNLRVVNLEALAFNLLSRNSEDTEINFSLRGQANFIWDTDTDSLIKDLINAKDRDYDSVFNRYPRIENAEIIFKPFWWYFMPKNKSRISIEIVIRNE